MERLWFFVLLCFLSVIAVADDGAEVRGEGNTSWGFFGSAEIGGMSITGEGLNSVEENHYGTVSRDGLVVLLSGGVNYRKPWVCDLGLAVSYTAGSSFAWDDIFGDTGSSLPLLGESLAVQVEVHPLFPSLHGIQPFIGGGYSLMNRLVDSAGDGFVQGRGPFIVGGLYVLNSLGFDSIIPFYSGSDSYFGLRLSAYYRFPYSYSFRLNWDEVSGSYSGPADLGIMHTFFDNAFSAGSITISVGLSLGTFLHKSGPARR